MRSPPFITALSVLILAASGIAGYRNLTAPRFAQVLEVREVSEASGKTAFDVRYRLDGKEDVIRLPYDPGKQIPLEDGKLVLETPAK